eukprot:Polyplicarium_translucidae@DN634_c0_g1_i1.p1
MVGTMSDVSFADAIVKGFTGFDVTGALEGMHKNAFSPPDQGGRGRRGLPDFISKGFIPRGSEDEVGTVHEVVSRTLNHAFADWAIAKAARAVEGQEVFTEEEILQLEERGSNWKNIFDTDRKFFRVKDADGNFIRGFDQYLWGGDLTEGGPWQFRFYAPHDPLALAALYGGQKEMCEKLEESNTHPGHVHRRSMLNNGYGYVIHEMIEMNVYLWGQNSHNNQPSHHATYMFAAAYNGEPDLFGVCLARGQHWLRHTLQHAYNSTHFSGDEDNGEMAAWFVLSALGLYDMAPASGEYMLGIPLFKEVKANMLGGEKTITGSDCNSAVYRGETKTEDCVAGAVRAYKDGQETDDLVTFRLPFAVLQDSDQLTFDFDYVPPTNRPETTD